MPPRFFGGSQWTSFITGRCSSPAWPARMHSFDPEPPPPLLPRLLRLLLLLAFLAWVLIGHFAHAAVTVTTSTPNWNPAGSAGGATELAELLKQPVGTGRPGYPSIDVNRKSAMTGAAARGAMRSIWRAAGWVGAGMMIVQLGGEFYNWLQCSTNQICKPGQGAQTDPFGNNPPGKYCMDVSSWGYGYCAAFPSSTCELNSDYGAGSYRTDSGYGYCYTSAFGGIKRYISKVSNACPVGYGWKNGACVNFAGTDPVPVTDSELENATQAYISAHPGSAIQQLKDSGAWHPTSETLSPQQTDVKGQPFETRVPEIRNGVSGEKVTKTEPGTKAVQNPTPAGNVSNSVTIYNYNTTTVTHADGTVESETVAEKSGTDLDLPDDYAREPTLQEIRDSLIKKPDPAPKPETATAPQTALQTYFDKLKTVPIVDTIGGGLDRWENDFDGGGSCPTYDIPVYGVVVTMTAHCVVGESIRSFLAAALAVVYSVAAVRIFLSA